MRRASLFTAVSASLIASPAFADAGAHHGADVGHFLVQHGWAVAIIGVAMVAGVAFLIKRKG